jgi:Ca-activated chloride channel family protein
MKENVSNIHWDYPWVLLGIPLIIMLWWFWGRNAQKSLPAWQYPSDASGIKIPVTLRIKLRPLLHVLRILTISAVLIALARPRGFLGSREENREVVDIQIAMDISLSMLARDFKPDRLEASKRMAADFIKNRSSDRIGLVIFAGVAFTQCPLTNDQSRLLWSLDNIKTGLLQDGTAIGEGLMKAVARLNESEAISKVVILLTDGVNNMGDVAPLDAAEAASALGVRVYTIGVGKIGKAMAPVSRDAFGKLQFGSVDVNIDETLLKKIAQTTHGKYFRAENEQALQEIFKEIDELEKTIIKVTEDHTRPDKFMPFLWFAFICFGIENILRLTLFKALNA